MSLSLRALAAVVYIPVLLGTLGFCVVARAQEPGPVADPAELVTKEGPQKPVRNTGWVTTTDSVALLTVGRTPKVGEAPELEIAAEATKPNSREEARHPSAAELASVEKQIREKQTRIVLLMKLFVKDERPFLNDPANPGADVAARERRKYEQDELLYDTAELARLQAKLHGMTAR